jgi:hypothetical protein
MNCSKELEMGLQARTVEMPSFVRKAAAYRTRPILSTGQ